MKPRRGVALITALWLVVAIAAVTLEFSLEAKERRVLGVNAAERGVQRAAALGALALVQSRLDYALRTRLTNGSVGSSTLRSSDPWLDADSLYGGVVIVDSIPVEVRAADGGAQLNINTLTEDEIKTFFGFLLNDYTAADQLAQTIMDWRDVDDVPRVRGAERDDYVKAGKLALPANGSFREIDDLLLVQGVTPAIFAAARPFLTTRGAPTINLNAAPPQVLRILPGMSDAVLAQIVNLRSQGRRITSVAQVMSAAQRGRATSAAVAQASAAQTQRLAARASVEATQLQFTFTVRAAPQAQPLRLTAILQRASTNNLPFASILWREW